jgi:hypothetical protein
MEIFFGCPLNEKVQFWDVEKISKIVTVEGVERTVRQLVNSRIMLCTM